MVARNFPLDFMFLLYSFGSYSPPPELGCPPPLPLPKWPLGSILFLLAACLPPSLHCLVLPFLILAAKSRRHFCCSCFPSPFPFRFSRISQRSLKGAWHLQQCLPLRRHFGPSKPTLRIILGTTSRSRACLSCFHPWFSCG